MNGIGWVCDECGKTEVLAGDAFALGGSRNTPPPEGWYLLFKAAPDRAMESERWEFCSIECIHAQTKPTERDSALPRDCYRDAANLSDSGSSFRREANDG